MDLERISRSVIDIEEELRKHKEMMMEKGKLLFHEAFQAFFSSHPEVKQIYWVQYTPYFNDGEPCVFSVGEICMADTDDPSVPQEYPFEHYWEGEERYIYGDNLVGLGVQKSTWQDFKFLEKIIQNQKDLMLSLFDDHVLVVATKDGFNTHGYSHD